MEVRPRRGSKPVRRARRLPQLLSELAQEVYDIANGLERTGELHADLAEYGANKISDRITLSGADRAQRFVDLYDESVEMLRGDKRGGRFPSVSMYWLIRKTDEWGSTVPEIARQLLRRNVSPESKSDDPNPQRQWRRN